MDTATTAPPGAYVEVGPNEIDEGKFNRLLAIAMRKGFRDLNDYIKETGDAKGKVVITPKITLQRMKGSEELIEITYTIPTKVPTATRASTAKERGGKLLAQPAGTNPGHPDQQLFYDARGNVIGGVDQETGEDHNPVAGKIAAAGR